MPTQVVNTPLNSPFAVVVIDGIPLPTYAAGGVNISIGELGFVSHAAVVGNIAASGFGRTGLAYTAVVASGSGNIVTIQAFGGSAEYAAVAMPQRIAVAAYGPGR